MKLIDNVNETWRDDIQKELNRGSRISIVAASFSIYAFRELKKELSDIKELDFIFNTDLYTGNDDEGIKSNEMDLFGTAFETRLKNDLLQQELARECADWIREKVRFRANISGERMPGFVNVGETTY